MSGRRSRDAAWLGLLSQRGITSFVGPDMRPLPALLEAADQFNRGAYAEAHETLETLWRSTDYPLRLFYHALFKAAVGLEHLGKHNLRGARSQLEASLSLLAPFLPHFMGLCTDGLADALAVRLRLAEGGQEVRWQELEMLPRPHLARTATAPPSGGPVVV
ncbi:MAG: DUF309 domain-containing protein [Chloroflexi bacterium]|nr:DUF309 domain-containing protein [Chloroflexota bacterium]